MSKLEDLVPPLELCRKIPEGCFADSALIIDGYGIVYGRFGRIGKTMMYGMQTYPAPTLQEILLAIDESGGYCPSCRYQANTWQLDYEDDPICDESMLPVLVDESDRYNPATAALKLWLEINSIPSIPTQEAQP